jgi:hypothetical protein
MLQTSPEIQTSGIAIPLILEGKRTRRTDHFGQAAASYYRKLRSLTTYSQAMKIAAGASSSFLEFSDDPFAF